MNPPLPLFGKGENGGILGLFPAETIIDSIFITVKTFHDRASISFSVMETKNYIKHTYDVPAAARLPVSQNDRFFPWSSKWAPSWIFQ